MDICNVLTGKPLLYSMRKKSSKVIECTIQMQSKTLNCAFDRHCVFTHGFHKYMFRKQMFPKHHPKIIQTSPTHHQNITNKLNK